MYEAIAIKKSLVNNEVGCIKVKSMHAVSKYLVTIICKQANYAHFLPKNISSYMVVMDYIPTMSNHVTYSLAYLS